MTKQNQQETMRFSMHPDMIFQIIKAQAGTLAKAIAELVMNSVDAGATHCSIILNEQGLIVEDDGKGFASRQEIEDFFRQFGTPHEEGDAVYGRYRMGRGQIMAFTKNHWRTGQFKMDVDIKNRGLDFDFVSGLEKFKGCRIEADLYAPMVPSDYHATLRELKELIAYVNIPVKLNGEVITVDPKTEKWNHETEDAYIRLKENAGLKVYNMGILVREYPSYAMGVGGVVVSKEALEVNFARNDVLTAQCAIWKRIKPYLKSLTRDKARSKKRLTEDDRRALVEQLIAGDFEAYEAFNNLKVITDIQGRHYTLSNLENKAFVVAAPEKGHRIAEAAHMRKLAFVLSPETLDRFDVNSVGELKQKLLEAFACFTGGRQSWMLGRIKSFDFRDFSEVGGMVKSGYMVYKPKELKRRDKILLNTLNRVSYDIATTVWQVKSKLGVESTSSSRTINLGSSEEAEAWTDGSKNITLTLDLAKQCNVGYHGFNRVISVLVHEYIHDFSDTDSHEHDVMFYQAFHDVMTYKGEEVGKIVKKALKGYIEMLDKEGIKISKRLLDSVDLDAKHSMLIENGEREKEAA